MAVKTNAKQFLESLVAGDMITFHSQTATHWGIYVGDKKVVHLTGEVITNSSDQSEALFTVAGKQYTKAAVKEDDFLDVAEAFDKYERNCKDTPKMTPDDPEDIVELAKTMVGNIYYNEMWNSCKKLAIYCRYDLSNLSGTCDENNENDEDNEVNEDNEVDEDDEDDDDERAGQTPMTMMTATPWVTGQRRMMAAPKRAGQTPMTAAPWVTGQRCMMAAPKRAGQTPMTAAPWGMDIDTAMVGSPFKMGAGQVPMDAAPLVRFISFSLLRIELNKVRVWIFSYRKMLFLFAVFNVKIKLYILAC
ncbi:uncharacterized protein LOC132713186 [Ruditapes philippinarum]|uniref:uncharacterized protein LOC132713186 n=1 Tax=Ruditapes philippinarum TaxID=129788 RepID=UPI00295BA3A4|nr:uncharacterized protein LOC132713186 [Ruditapes philippinarum]